jgi:hypothetical protein
MDALTQANLRLLKRLDEMERRLGRIEGRLGIEADEAPRPPVPVPEPEMAREPPPETHPEPVRPMPATAATLETQLGLTWVNRIAVVTCILAAAFFFKYAVDSQWIGEAGRVVLGVLAGFACLGASEALFRRAHAIYAQGICGLGIAILYLAFDAAFAFYQLIPQAAAFGLMVLTTLLAAGLALRYEARAIAALGLLGGFATPAVLSTGVDRPWFLFGYLLVLSAGALTLSHLRRWTVLEVLAFAGTVVLYAAWLDQHGAGTGIVPDLAWQMPGWLFLLAAYTLFAWPRREWLVCATGFLACCALAVLWPDRVWPFLLSLTALSAAALALADRFAWRYLPPAAFVSWCVAYQLWDGGVAVPLAGTLLFHIVLFLLFLGWLPWRTLVRGRPAGRPELVLAPANAVVMWVAFHSLLNDEYEAWQGFMTAALAAAHLAAGWPLWRGQDVEERDSQPALLSLGLALALVTLAIPIQFSGFRITVAWAVEAAALTWLATRLGSRGLQAGAVVMYVLIAGRLLLLDASVRTDWLLLNERFVAFAAAAASLGAAAWWMRRAPIYVAAHIALLGGLCLEACDWVVRSGTNTVASDQSIAVSVLTAIYAVGLVTAGILTRTALNRLLGLVLIAFVVAKLYLYDVWLLRRLHRIVAFAALGGLLLAMSFLYSRYRTAIEGWWQDKKSV